MAHFLRDEQIANVSATENNLSQLSATFLARTAMINANIPDENHADKAAFVTYIIRFDNKGYRVFLLEDLLKYFSEAKTVERVLFTLETGESLRSGRQIGTYMELRLDEKEPNKSFLTVTSDDKDWVDASFAAVQDTLAKSRNRNGWVRTAWTMFAVQIIGVTLGFLLSLWAAAKIAPKLAIENALVFSFLFILLIFSNTWTFLSHSIVRLMNAAFPSVKFLRKGKEHLHWLLQAIVGGIVLAIVLYVLDQSASFVLQVFGSILKKE